MLWLSVLLAVFTIPFEAASSVPLVGSVPRLVGGFTLMAFLAALGVKRRFYSVPGFYRVFALYVLWTGLSRAWEANDAEYKTRFALLVQLALFSMLIVQVARTRRERAILATSFGFGSVVAAIIVLVNKITGVTYLDQELSIATVVTRSNVGHVARYTIGVEDPNYIGMTLLLGSLMLLWGLWVLRGRRGVQLGLALMPLIAFSALLTGSRGSTVVAPAVTVTYLFVVLGRRSVPRLIAIVATTATAGFLVWRQLPADTQYRVLTGFDSTQSTSKTRTKVWLAGYHAFLRRPIHGYGLGSYQFVVKGEVGQAFVAHNTFINIAVELGTIGIVLFLLSLLRIWRRSYSLPVFDRIFVRTTLVLFMAAASFLSGDLKKVTFFTLALLVSVVTNRENVGVDSTAGRFESRFEY